MATPPPAIKYCEAVVDMLKERQNLEISGNDKCLQNITEILNSNTTLEMENLVLRNETIQDLERIKFLNDELDTSLNAVESEENTQKNFSDKLLEDEERVTAFIQEELEEFHENFNFLNKDMDALLAEEKELDEEIAKYNNPEIFADLEKEKQLKYDKYMVAKEENDLLSKLLREQEKRNKMCEKMIEDKLREINIIKNMDIQDDEIDKLKKHRDAILQRIQECELDEEATKERDLFKL